LAASAQISAIQAQWIKALFTRPSLWTPILLHDLYKLDEGVYRLTRRLTAPSLKRISLAWYFAVSAWSQLYPRWNSDLTQWTTDDLLNFPVPSTSSIHYPSGLLLSHVVELNPSTGHLRLVDRATISQMCSEEACAQIWSAVNCLDHSQSFAAQVSRRLLRLSPPLPPPPPLALVAHPHLIVAGSSFPDLSTAVARRFLDTRKGVDKALDWRTRAISRLAYPPRDIWSRVWRSATTPKQRETFYKILLNALPLGARIAHFAPEDANCPACPTSRQTLRHFLFDCPLAQQVWSDFAFAFDISYESISLRHCLFSWPTGASFFLGRAFGYRLQAGHAVALHTLWTAAVVARFEGTRITRASISARFRIALQRHFAALRSSPRWAPRIGDLPSFFLY
jgi:hypothetical protein